MIAHTTDIKNDEYTKYVEDTFDLNVGDKSIVNIPNSIPFNRLGDWNIGVICGASGSGKSSILRSLGEIKEATFDDDKALISNFENKTPQEASELLCAMGLSSVPTWLRPFKCLSNGEQYRASLAKIMSESSEDETILIDEFTSVVDRIVAKSMSTTLSKYVRRNSLRVIIATCHYDIFEWLQPDWIYDLNKGGVLEKGDYLRQGRPKIELSVYRTTSDTWRIFAPHHYMTNELNKSAYCYCFTWEERLVGFCAMLPLTGKGLSNAWMFSRVVVLPDYQGLGIGKAIFNTVGGGFLSPYIGMFICIFAL